MRDLFRAEWLKIAGNRWVASCLIWIFPVMGIALPIVMGLILTLSSAARESFRQSESTQWTDNAVGVWSIPNNPIGRLILLGFTAVVFAGEYQWQTWKNVVPRNRRVLLILIKFLALGVFVVVAFVLMSILWTLGWGLLTVIADIPYGPRITGEVLQEFAEDYVLAAGLAFTSTIISAGYAALAGMLTRSILGGVLVGFGLTLAEGFSILALLLIGWFTHFPEIVNGYRYLPFYNLINVSSWLTDNKPATMRPYETGDYSHIFFSDSLAFSIAVLAVWVVGLITLTAVLFRRQDIT